MGPMQRPSHVADQLRSEELGLCWWEATLAGVVLGTASLNFQTCAVARHDSTCRWIASVSGDRAF